MSVPVQHPMYIDGQFVTWRGDAWIDAVSYTHLLDNFFV